MQPERIAPRKRLKHRIPRTLRQHWKIAAALGIFVLVLATVFGSTRVRPYITGDATVIASDITENISGTADLLDVSISHQVSLDITDADYASLQTSFQDDGDKEWVQADITIDGTLITDVGVRLKGNSTLSSLRGTSGGGPGGGAAGGGQLSEAMAACVPDGAQAQEGVPAGGAPAIGAPAGGDTGSGMGGGMGGMGSISFDEPEGLPLLISFDHYVSGRAYQGMSELSLRPYTPALNEAMALSITAASGQATQDYSYAAYSVNGGAETTRLFVVNPDDSYANSLFEGSGVLYKADSTSSLTYQGDDQTTYQSQFKQVNAEGTADVQPIISFVQWLDSADDEAFDTELSNWVDVESFAKYVATQNLLGNSDDMAGPGKNYYLYYDLDSKKFTVVSWDLNLALNSNTTAAPHDTVSMGGGMRREQAADTAAPAGTAALDATTVTAEEGCGPAGFGQGGFGQGGGPGQPGGGQPEGEQAGDRAGGPGGMMSGNSLKERFLASAAFTEIYDDAYRSIYQDLYSSGQALSIVDEVVDSIPLTDGLTSDELASEAAEMKERLTARTDSLAEDPVILG